MTDPRGSLNEGRISCQTATSAQSSGRSDPEHRQQPLLVLGFDPGDYFDVLLETGAPELGSEQLIDLEDPGTVRHLDLDPDCAVAPGHDLDLFDRVGRQ